MFFDLIDGESLLWVLIEHFFDEVSEGSGGLTDLREDLPVVLFIGFEELVVLVGLFGWLEGGRFHHQVE